MKAIITAGGKGTRLYPTSRAYPKELIQFCGVPVIEYSINILRENGITDIIILAGTKKGALQDYLGNGSMFGVNISYVIQEEPEGLGQAIQILEPHISDDNFILMLGDNIYSGDVDLKQMMKNHIECDASSTIFIEHSQEPEKFGIVKFDNINSKCKKITALYEKPRDEKVKNEFRIDSGWYAIAGMYILNRDIFKFLKDTPCGFNNEIQLTDAINLSLNNGNNVQGYIFNGKRIDVGTWDYLIEEKQFYNNLSDSELKNIISKRNKIKDKINGDFKDK